MFPWLIGGLTLCIFVLGLVLLVRRQLDDATRARLHIAARDSNHLVNRLARRFMLLGVLMTALVWVHYQLLASHAANPATYQQAIAAGRALTGTVTQVQQPWYACIGKPSVCSPSITVSDEQGAVMVDALLLQAGESVVPGDRVALVWFEERYYPVDRRPFLLDSRVQRNSLGLAAVCLLFLVIGAGIRAGLLLIGRR